MKQLVCLLGFMATTLPTPLHAYVQSTSDDGVPLAWKRECVTYFVNENGSDEIADKQGTYDAVKASLETWNAVSCKYAKFVYGGTTTDSVAGDTDSTNLGTNIVVWRGKGQWPHQQKVIALTSIVFNPKTGEISDADIELNGDFTFSVGDAKVVIDVQNTVTHELGHSLGLDHTPISAATMYASAPPGEIKKRTLHQDDIDGVCAIYPVDKNPNNCNDPITPPKEGNSGCRFSGAPSPLAAVTLFLLFVLIAARSRRRAV